MNITAVTISRNLETLEIGIPFYCHNEGWKPIFGRDNADKDRLEYITGRYNSAIRRALELYPSTTHILIADSYYLHFKDELRLLISHYHNWGSVLGASIWFEDKSRIRPFISYYDTMSIREWKDRRWRGRKHLPTGLMKASGVGGCWIFPRSVWLSSGGFHILSSEMLTSRCIGIQEAVLDCDVKLWRTPQDNPNIHHYPWSKRIRCSVGEFLDELRIPH